MPYLHLLLFGIAFAPLGWPLAWLAAYGYRRVHDPVSAARLRLLVMAFLGITPAVLVAVDIYHPGLPDGYPTGTPPGYLLGSLMQVTAFPMGWILTATVIEFAIRSRARRAGVGN